MVDLSFAQNQVKAARAVKTLENRIKMGLIKEYSLEDVIAEYKSYHGVVITPEVVADQENRAAKIGYKPEEKPKRGRPRKI